MKAQFILALFVVQIFTQLIPESSSNNDQSLNSRLNQAAGTKPKLSFIDIFGSDQCQLPDIPQKLAITCVTRLRARTEEDLPGAVDFFKTFLNRYAEMDCDAFDNIYFIWNNQKPPQQYAGLLDRKPYWKKNVFFMQTVKNGLDHRWALPPWAPQQALLSLDDDAQIDCQNIKKAFSQWKQNFIGGIGALASPLSSVRYHEFHGKTDNFTYNVKPQQYFSLAIPNVGIVPRHFADLYYAPFPEFEKMRETVIEMINCDDICLNVMVGYVYPEIMPMLLEGVTAIMKPSKVELNQSPLHYSNRTEALNRYIKILGESTLTYRMTNPNQYFNKTRTDPLRHHNCMLAMKRSVIQQKYLSNNHYYTFMRGVFFENSTELDQSLLEQIKKDQYIFSLPTDIRLQMNKTGKIDLGYKPKYIFDEAFGKDRYTLKQRESEEEKLEQLTKENDLLKLCLIIVVSVSLILCVGLAYKRMIVIKKNKNDLLNQHKIGRSEDLQLSENNEESR